MPDVIGQTIGNAIIGQIVGDPSRYSRTPDPRERVEAAQENAGLGTDDLAELTPAQLRERGIISDTYDVMIGPEGVGYHDLQAAVGGKGRMNFIGENTSEGLILRADGGASAHGDQYTLTWYALENGGIPVTFISQTGSSERYLMDWGRIDELNLTASFGVYQASAESMAIAHAPRDAQRARDAAIRYAEFQGASAYWRDQYSNLDRQALEGVARLMPVIGTYYAWQDYQRNPTGWNALALGLSLFGDGALAASLLRGSSMFRGVSGAASEADDALRVAGNGFDDAGRLERNGQRTVLDQGNGPTCGPTAACMVLDSLGRPANLGEVISRAAVRTDGIGMDEVAAILRQDGADAVVRSMSVDGLARATSQGRPAIAAVRTPQGAHAVVVDGVTTRRGVQVVAIRDPHGSQYFETVEAFSQRYMRQAVIIR